MYISQQKHIHYPLLNTSKFYIYIAYLRIQGAAVLRITDFCRQA